MLTSKVEQPTDICQVFRIDGLSGQRMQYRAGSVLLREGRTSPLEAFPKASGHVGASGPVGIRLQQVFTGTWLPFKPYAFQRCWLLQHWLAHGSSASMQLVHAQGRLERWQSPVDRARLEIVGVTLRGFESHLSVLRKTLLALERFAPLQ